MGEFKSYHAMVAVRTSTLTATQRAVWNAVSLRASSETGECWASSTTLAEDCALSDRAVRDALIAIASTGALVRSARPGQSTIWTVVPSALPQMPVEKERLDGPRNLVPPGTTFLGTPEPGSTTPEPGSTTPEPGSYDPVLSVHDPSPDPSSMNARALEPAADEGAFAIAEGLPWSVHIGSAKGILPTMPVPHQQAIRGAVRDGCTADDVRMLTDWLLNSGEHDGGWWRSKGHGWGPVLKDWRARVKVAREWSRAGRPTGPPSRAAPMPMHLRIGRAEGPAPPSDTPLWSSLTPAQQIEAIERLGFDGVDDSEWPRVMEQEAAKILEARQ